MKSMKNINEIFPVEIISDILTRLPAESALECKLVCTTWKNLIQQPSFRKMHLARQNHPDSVDSGKLRYVISHLDDDGDYDKHVYYFEFNENEDWKYGKPDLRQMKIETPFEAYILIGSFNGLICIYEFQTEQYISDIIGPALILNPVTREYVVLPKFDLFPEYDHVACGFGYLAETDEYKVVRIYMAREESTVVDVEVYTVGSGKGWRHVGKIDFGFRFYVHLSETSGVFLNGCLHWRNKEGGMVVVFDLAQEKFRDHIPPPPVLMEGFEDNIHDFIVIGVSGGGILYYAVCLAYEGHDLYDVWLLMKMNANHVMKEQVDYQSWGWSKVTSLDQREPFAFTGDGTVLRYDQGKIQKFLSSTSTWEDLVNIREISLHVYPHKHTLVSLKDLGEEDAEIMNLAPNLKLLADEATAGNCLSNW